MYRYRAAQGCQHKIVGQFWTERENDGRQDQKTYSVEVDRCGSWVVWGEVDMQVWVKLRRAKSKREESGDLLRDISQQ